jgi:hypothetical protein
VFSLGLPQSSEKGVQGRIREKIENWRVTAEENRVDQQGVAKLGSDTVAIKPDVYARPGADERTCQKEESNQLKLNVLEANANGAVHMGDNEKTKHKTDDPDRGCK